MRKALLCLGLLGVVSLLPQSAHAGEGKEVLFLFWLGAAVFWAVVYGLGLLIAAVVTSRDTLKSFWRSCLLLTALAVGGQLLSIKALDVPGGLYLDLLLWGALGLAFFLGLTVKQLRLHPPTENP